MLAQVALLLAWAWANADAAPLGETLVLPRPRVLPCARFETVELDVGQKVDALSTDEGTWVEWRGGGRDVRVKAWFWSQPAAPIRAAALPARVRLVASKPLRALRLQLHCKLYEPTERGERFHDADPFMGVKWTCRAAGCQVDVGYALPRALAASPRRLRLCSKDPARNWADNHEGYRPCRDVTPAFANREAAVALAEDVLADARRTVEDACARGGVCNSWRRDLLALLRPARWHPTEWRNLARSEVENNPYPFMKMSAGEGERRLDMDCSFGNEDAHCNLYVRDRAGAPRFTYMPIDSLEGPPEALLWRDDHVIVELTAAPGAFADDDPPGCFVSQPLLSLRP